MSKGITRALLLSAVTTCLVTGAARAQTVELKASHYLPPSHTVQKVLEAWAAELDKRSGGRIKLKIYPASQLGPVQRQMDLARNGQTDLAVGLVGATPGRYPMTELASLPFAWPSAGATSAIMSKRLTELAPKYLAPDFAGLHILWMGVPPISTFFTTRKEIGKPADLKGLKMRFQGEENAAALRVLGAVPLQVPPGEVADGMAKGVIDGAVFNFEAAKSFGLATVTHHVVEPGFLSAELPLVMNEAKYDALPADLKAIIDETTGPAAAERLGQQWDVAEQHGRQDMLAHNVSINTLAPPEEAQMKTELEPLATRAVASLEAAGKPAKAFLDAYRK